MIDIYNQHMLQEGVSTTARERLPARAADEDEDPPVLRRTATDPLLNRFQRLPNPDLEMHVYPHLANGKYPVPGYVTVFPMYEAVQYAMPGEVAPRQARQMPTELDTGVGLREASDRTGDAELRLVQRLSPPLYRVAQDFRADYAMECAGHLDDRALSQIVQAAPSTSELHDLDRRLTALNVSEAAYTAQRQKLACTDVKRALIDLKLATR